MIAGSWTFSGAPCAAHSRLTRAATPSSCVGGRGTKSEATDLRTPLARTRPRGFVIVGSGNAVQLPAGGSRRPGLEQPRLLRDE
jgi:hypothetical protein